MQEHMGISKMHADKHDCIYHDFTLIWIWKYAYVGVVSSCGFNISICK